MNNERLHYMDNLRAFAMLLGVLFHAALAYSTSLHQVWPAADANHSVLVDFFFGFSHLFRMPLFFLVAGFFACLLYEKRGLGRLIKNRLMRITVPFVVFLPLLTVMMIVAIGWAMGNVENKSPMLAMVAALADNPDAPKPPPSTMHLWFLYYLMIFYFLTAVVIKINRFNLVSWVSGWISKEPLRFILLAPLCLVPAMLMSGVPYPSPEQFTPKVWACWFFGCFFFLGWVFNRHGNVVEQFRPYWKPMLLTVLVLYPVFVYLIPDESITIEQAMAMMVESREITVNSVALSFLGAYIALYTTLFLLVLGKDFFNRKSAVARLISDSSYWIYLIHLPVVFAIQFALMDVDWPLWVELFISALVTFAVGMLSYLVFVRWTPVGWMLNGRKKRAGS